MATAWVGVALAALLTVVVAIVPCSALATFPGDDGRIAYLHTGDPDHAEGIFSILPDGAGRQRLTQGKDVFPRWSPDGARIVFIRSQDGTDFVVTIDAAGGGLAPVVAPGTWPSFSPDGRRILYRGVRRSIRTIRIDGTRPRVVLPKGRGYFEEAIFSPDGRRIALTGTPAGRDADGIWTVRSDGSSFRRVTSDSRDGQLDYSPDSRHIVYVRSGGPNAGIRMVRANGSHDRPVHNGPDLSLPRFAPGGDRIVFGSTGGQFSSCSDIYTMSLAGTDLRRVTQNCDSFGSGAQSSGPSWQPLPPLPSSEFEIVKVKRNKRKGTAKLRLEVPGGGKVRLKGTKQLNGVSRRMPVAGPVALPVKPRGKAKRRLRKRGAAKVRASVTYNPDGAERNAKSKRFKLKRRR